ncbi:retromer subunit VPS35 Ecym_5180 [Eremothecium cymbalariae DBVPG|uniref:Vacuolar protein sorting-associated protein 35 n=1 Tax=Eremothecium cymbalariae (strain CBS 270.75 / DBVPG 7215 / KCTC 17166 / NRRL Y-17582) TaxID=931890 RepID=I6ND11_ERECY|nr:hypothetical protein Ecym_5180 [Eremothecium cymbalariae DBVPG\
MSYADSVEQAASVIKQQAILIQRNLAQRKLMDALKHISIMLTELRNPSLTPKQYYELYILVYDALTTLSQYLVENHPKRHHLADLYELVQYAGNILPRLYLMITVGTAFLQIEDSPREEILKDMIEMCKGVQNPVRGLFLRYYLSQRTKEWLLPDTQEDGNDGEGQENGNKKFNVEFIINNFIEMNKLWVRLQHYGPLRERELRTKERKELQILIGSNLVRLSQIVEDDLKLYCGFILPQILEQIVQCRDVVSQEYLLDVICQVFPDEFHLATLSVLLEVTLKLNPDVSINKVVSTLIERFIGYMDRQTVDIDSIRETFKKLSTQDSTENTGSGITNSGDLFFVFWNYLEKLCEARPDLPLNDLLPLVQGILRLSLIWYPAKLSNIDCLLKFTVKKCQENGGPNVTADSEYLFQDLLLSLSSNDIFYRVLTECDSYQKLLSLQNVGLQKVIVNCILDTIFKRNIRISSKSHLDKILLICQSIIKVNNIKFHTSPLDDSERAASQDDDSTSSLLNLEQEKLAQLVHICYHKSIEKHVELLLTCKSWLYKGGIQLRYTYPAVIASFWKLIHKAKIKSKLYSSRKTRYKQLSNQLFKYVSRCLNDLFNTVGVSCSDMIFKLNLQTAAIADHLGLSEISYDFFTQAFTVFEESLNDSRTQFQAIVNMAQVLQKTRSLYVENHYDVLVTRCTLYGSKLLRKQDQCRAVYLCSHLWWATEIPLIGEEEGITKTFYREGKRVLECLQRSLRVADSIMDNVQSCQLMVEILNRCCYYFIHGDESATHVGTKYINGLIELIETNLKSLKMEESAELKDDKTMKASIHTRLVIGIDGSFINLPTAPTATLAAVSHKSPTVPISSLVLVVTEYLQRTLKYIEDQKLVDDRFKAIIL